MKSQLKIVKNQFKSDTISEIIGRDAKEVLKRNPPSFEPDTIDFWNRGVKWLTSVVKYEGWRK